jgi:hypothetical protein
VGIGTNSPQAALHVASSSGNGAKVLVADDDPSFATRELLELRNNGGIVAILDDTGRSERWSFGTTGGNFLINNQNNAGVEVSVSPTGSLTITGVYSPSDRRLKKDVVVVVDALERLQRVHGYTYTKKATGQRELGVIAQEIEAAFPEAVIHDDDGVLAVSYSSLVAPLIEAVRELDDDNAELSERVRSLEAQLADSNARFARIERALKIR